MKKKTEKKNIIRKYEVKDETKKTQKVVKELKDFLGITQNTELIRYCLYDVHRKVERYLEGYDE